MLRTAVILVLAATALVARRDNGQTAFIGTWEGTYNSQPTRLASDGSYPEVTHRFRLTISSYKRSVTGSLQDLETRRRPSPIRKIESFGRRLCFDVKLDHTDERWCVSVIGDELSGVWTTGPEGGKELEGMGAGARLFAVRGHRAPPRKLL